jgi:hypothetical protein
MAVALQMISVLVRVDAIRAKYPGGWDQFLKDAEPDIGSRAWYDEHLYRDGAMSPHDIEEIVEFWQEKGLTTHREESGSPVEWIDICVTEFFGPTLPCSWYADLPDAYAAYLKGTEPGRIMTRNDFPDVSLIYWQNWLKNN